MFKITTIADNPLFLNELGGSYAIGPLYYYFYNYRAAFVSGGINWGGADENMTRGIGLVPT